MPMPTNEYDFFKGDIESVICDYTKHTLLLAFNLCFSVLGICSDFSTLVVKMCMVINLMSNNRNRSLLTSITTCYHPPFTTLRVPVPPGQTIYM